VKMKQFNIQLDGKKENNEGDILMSDSIANYKTVASIANYGVLIKEFEDITNKRAGREIKQANCEGIQFGFSEFIKNGAFGIIYIA